MSRKAPTKALCKWRAADIDEHLDELKKDIAQAAYICRKCGRAARDKKILCKPVAL